MSKSKKIDYYWLKGELMEGTYHMGAPLSVCCGSCAKMFFTYMDYLVGDITYAEYSKIFKEVQRVVNMTRGSST